MEDSEIQVKSLEDEMEKTGKVLRGHQKALQLLQEAKAGDDITVSYLAETIAKLRDEHCDLETRLQLLTSRDNQNASTSTETCLENMTASGKTPIVYIIHSKKDEDFIQPIVDDLMERGLKVVHPDRDYDAGRSVLGNIEKWINRSDRVVAVLSPAALDSEWVHKELLQTRTEQTNRRKQMLIPILYNIGSEQIPHYYQDRHCVDAQKYEGNTEALCRRVAKEVFADDIPFIGQLRLGDIATGLAWGYFYGYLKLIIPTFRKRLMESKYWVEEGAVKGNMSTRFIVLCPDSCFCHTSLEDSDARIETMTKHAKERGSIEGFIPPVHLSRGGTLRSYKQGVYRINMDDGQTYYVVGEYPTTVLSMYEMEDQEWAGLKSAERLYQKKKFVSLLRDILQEARMEQYVLLLSYDDTQAEGFKYPIADDLVRVIREEAAGAVDNESQDTS